MIAEAGAETARRLQRRKNNNGDGYDTSRSKSLLRVLLAFYSFALAARIQLTKTLTASLVAICLDAAAQNLQGRVYTLWRTLP